MAAAAGELLVVDGSRVAPPRDLPVAVRWIGRPGVSVARLREVGLAEASGEIVAITEDHCVVGSDWCAAVLRAHAEHPSAAAIGGSVDTGSRVHRVDWASFYAGHAPWMAPLPRGETTHLDGINVSYKRGVLDHFRDGAHHGALETVLGARLVAAGERLVTDDRIRVSHYQSYGILGTAVMHFHGGRAFEGHRAAMVGHRGRWSRAARCLVAPLPRAMRRLAMARAKGEPLRRIASVVPAMLWLMFAQSAGELASVLSGAGDSPHRLP